jgi:hypothetical protein
MVFSFLGKTFISNVEKDSSAFINTVEAKVLADEKKITTAIAEAEKILTGLKAKLESTVAQKVKIATMKTGIVTAPIAAVQQQVNQTTPQA